MMQEKQNKQTIKELRSKIQALKEQLHTTTEQVDEKHVEVQEFLGKMGPKQPRSLLENGQLAHH
jgi:hypothetical protein